MDAVAYRPDGRTSRFMSLTGCDLRQANFCLEATNFDFAEATRMYRRDVAGISFQERPPCREEQEKELDAGLSLARIAGIVGSVAVLGLADGFLFAQLTAGVVMAATLAAFLQNIPENLKQICGVYCTRERDGTPSHVWLWSLRDNERRS